MTKLIDTPWAEMHSDAQRRVDKSVYDIFWIKDYQSNYGLLIKFAEGYAGVAAKVHLRGLSIIERVDSGILEVYLMLKNFEDLELFTTLCGDLLTSANSCGTSDKLFATIMGRISRWQLFLSLTASFTLSKTIQMGLFTELNFVVKLAPHIGIDLAIQNWTGPEMDKKDFSTHNCFVEVKSLISSKGPFVHISSLHQLDATVKPLYLVTYHMSINESGFSIESIINEILELVGSNEDLADAFTYKLARYGYVEGITEPPFCKWIIDLMEVYDVSNTFPKITADNIPGQIIDVNYQIDLARCQEFIINFDSIKF
jgi:Putative  PD-(D/E)XK family member, (DUF4420)